MRSPQRWRNLLVASGFVVARRGQIISGRVADAVKAGRVKGTSRLALELTDATLVDGENIPVRTQLVQYSGGTLQGRDAAAIGTTTGLGAAIGAAAGGGAGAGIGAGAGAELDYRRPVNAGPSDRGLSGVAAHVPDNGANYDFDRRSSVAFEPVRQEDYAPDGQARPRLVRAARIRRIGYPYGYPPFYPSVGVVIVGGGRRY